MVPLVAVARAHPGYLTVGAVGDHVLAAAVRGTDALVPGEHRLAPVALHLEVHRALALHGAEPHRLPAIVDDHRPFLRLALVRGDEDVAWGGGPRPRDHVDAGRAEVGARAEG